MGEGNRYEFDWSRFKFIKEHKTVWRVLLNMLKWMLVTVSMALFYYAIFALFFSTVEEKRLIRENRMYEQMYGEMVRQNKMNADVIGRLQLRDQSIYKQIFHAVPPSIDPVNSLDYTFDTDSVDSRNLEEYAAAKTKSLVADAATVDENFKKIFEIIEREEYHLPPMSAPLDQLGFAQIGASVGQKINPFIKVEAAHTGLDLLVGQGTPVLATADGVVEKVIWSKKGQGNVVEITHGNGYVTKYAHLADMKVYRGQNVCRGEVIGQVGMSGKSFAPHLHYEVLHDGVTEDPVNYLFACLSPIDYANVLYMAVHTEQSLD